MPNQPTLLCRSAWVFIFISSFNDMISILCVFYGNAFLQNKANFPTDKIPLTPYVPMPSACCQPPAPPKNKPNSNPKWSSQTAIRHKTQSPRSTPLAQNGVLLAHKGARGTHGGAVRTHDGIGKTSPKQHFCPNKRDSCPNLPRPPNTCCISTPFFL